MNPAFDLANRMITQAEKAMPVTDLCARISERMDAILNAYPLHQAWVEDADADCEGETYIDRTRYRLALKPSRLRELGVEVEDGTGLLELTTDATADEILDYEWRLAHEGTE